MRVVDTRPTMTGTMAKAVSKLLEAKAYYEENKITECYDVCSKVIGARAYNVSGSIKAQAHHLMMLCNIKFNALQHALQNYNAAKLYLQSDAVFLTNAAQLHRLLKEQTKARDLCQTAIFLNRTYANAYAILGSVLEDDGEYERAITSYRDSMYLENNPSLHTNIGNCLDKLGRYEEAKSEHYKALESGTVEAFCNLAMMARKERDYKFATSLYIQAIERDPTCAEARLGIGEIYLMNMRWQYGWINYLYRHRAAKSEKKWPWHEYGTLPTNGRILVIGEQGYGDAFMAARFFPLLRDSGFDFHVLVPNDLVGFFRAQFPDIAFIDAIKDKRHYVAYKYMMDLPAMFGNTWNFPYFHATPGADKNRPQSIKQIGYCWRGRSVPDPKRTIPFEEFKTIVDMAIKGDASRVWTVSLQLDATPDEKREFVTAIDASQNWETTLLWVHSCDVIVTIDTAIAHLAGAMGKRVICLVPYAPDWRWHFREGRVSQYSYWYPSMFLIRQDIRDDWKSAILAAKGVLRSILSD